MAGCGGKKMAYGGKVKKMREGGMSEEDKKLFGEKETDAPPPKDFKPSDDKKPVPKDKKGMHMMPNGKIMKDSDHKKKKMKAGGKVRGDGICSKGKTKGRMV